MNTYFTLSEKRDFIDADFKNSKLYQLGPLPEDKEERRQYFHLAVQYAGEFATKYHGKGWSYEYAMLITKDWMDSLDAMAREKSI